MAMTTESKPKKILDEVVTLDELKRWAMLRRARIDYYELVRDVVEIDCTEKDYAYYMEQTWGIKVDAEPRLADFTVVDEQKHLLFLLKYAGEY